MAHGKIGSSAGEHDFLDEVKPKEKPPLKDLAQNVKDNMKLAEMEEEKLKKDMTPKEREEFEKKDLSLSKELKEYRQKIIKRKLSK